MGKELRTSRKHSSKNDQAVRAEGSGDTQTGINGLSKGSQCCGVISIHKTWPLLKLPQNPFEEVIAFQHKAMSLAFSQKRVFDQQRSLGGRQVGMSQTHSAHSASYPSMRGCTCGTRLRWRGGIQDQRPASPAWKHEVEQSHCRTSRALRPAMRCQDALFCSL